MKRLFVSLMVIGGFILFGMQAAESAPMGSKADRARKRCSKIKSLGARAACCAKIRPASRLSPKKKLCRPVFARCGKIRNPKVKAACVARNRVKARVRDRLKGRRTERK